MKNIFDNIKCMRYLYCVLMLFVAITLSGQSRMPVIWKTVHGIVDTGYLARLPINLQDDEKLVFYQRRRDSIAVREQQLEWVTYRGDSLLIRHTHKGYSRLMRLLYEGEVRLYKVIEPWPAQHYYLVREGQWELLDRKEPKAAGYRFIRRNCPSFKTPWHISNDLHAVEMVSRLNDCIDGSNHYPMPKLNVARQRIGLIANIPGEKGSIGNDRYFPPFQLDRDVRGIVRWPIYAPVVSAYYERQIFRYYPKLIAQLDITLLHRNQESFTNLHAPQPTYPAKERLQITAFYFYPGFLFTTGHRRSLQLILGAGGMLAAPFSTRRQVELLDFTAIPLLPIQQEFRNILEPGIGYYLKLGTRFRLRPGLFLGFTIRADVLQQRWRYYEEFNRNTLYTNNFPHSPLLARKSVYRWQARVQYAW